jgi:hypothetical protein
VEAHSVYREDRLVSRFLAQRGRVLHKVRPHTLRRQQARLNNPLINPRRSHHLYLRIQVATHHHTLIAPRLHQHSVPGAMHLICSTAKHTIPSRNIHHRQARHSSNRNILVIPSLNNLSSLSHSTVNHPHRPLYTARAQTSSLVSHSPMPAVLQGLCNGSQQRPSQCRMACNKLQHPGHKTMAWRPDSHHVRHHTSSPGSHPMRSPRVRRPLPLLQRNGGLCSTAPVCPH